MNKQNLEPLLILGATGIFLLLLTSGMTKLLPEKQQVRPATVAQAVIQNPDKPAGKSDSLQPLFKDRDTISSLYSGLDVFYRSLKGIQRDHTLVHVAYFGDSMIEGDLVTQPLRQFLQRRFGGTGVGFVPITTPLPGFRSTIRQSFNSNWEVISFVHPDKKSGILPGISGYTYISEPEAETSFETVKGFGRFHQATLLYGVKNRVMLEMRLDTSTRVLSLVPESPVSVYKIHPDSAFSRLEFKVTSAEPGLFYGVNFEYGPGVYVDNYAFRGNSGLPLTSIPAAIFSGFNNALGNKLLIVHYGLNVFTPGVTDYHWYEQAMVRVIRHIKQASPGISILLVSMPDRSTLIDGEYHTPEGLPEFIRLQQRVAASENVAFFNLYEAMGGAESMKRWVEGHPKLAGEDYTHPNYTGTVKIASMIYDFLMNGYERYLQQKDSIPSGSLTTTGL